MAASTSPQAEPDLFGYLPPPPSAGRRRSVREVAVDSDEQLFDFRVRCIDAFKELARSVDHVLGLFSMAMVDFQTEDTAGEIDRLIEELGKDLADEIRAARHQVFE